MGIGYWVLGIGYWVLGMGASAPFFYFRLSSQYTIPHTPYSIMRTRFAPSPTGSLHVGNFRTAIYAYLLAKQSQGEFLVRVEDTDQKREVPGAIEGMLNVLHWAGITPDEGVMLENGVPIERGAYGPYRQSKRLALYRRYVDQLLAAGHAYVAFDTPEEIDRMRKEEQQAGNPAPSYNAGVRMRMKNAHTISAEEVRRRIEAGEPHVIRMQAPSDIDGARVISFDDDIRGTVAFPLHTVEDQILLKSDGFPTYHLAHVVDDHLMKIDLVIRGEEWLSSLPKHLLLFRMFGWDSPRYAHVPLLLNADRTKLSKRQGSVSVEEYVQKGYLPEALFNFLALLGWNPGTTQEVFSRSELIASFSLDRVQKAGAVFDLTKLDWLQGQWMRAIPAEEFADRILPLVAARHPAAHTDSRFPQLAALIQERITFFPEAPDMLGFFYERPVVSVDLLANAKQKVAKEELPRLLALMDALLTAVPESDWTAERILADVRATIEREGLKLGQLLWPLRALLTGREYSPGAVEVAAALGKEETLGRVRVARKHCG